MTGKFLLFLFLTAATINSILCPPFAGASCAPKWEMICWTGQDGLECQKIEIPSPCIETPNLPELPKFPLPEQLNLPLPEIPKPTETMPEFPSPSSSTMPILPDIHIHNPHYPEITPPEILTPDWKVYSEPYPHFASITYEDWLKLIGRALKREVNTNSSKDLDLLIKTFPDFTAAERNQMLQYEEKIKQANSTLKENSINRIKEASNNFKERQEELSKYNEELEEIIGQWRQRRAHEVEVNNTLETLGPINEGQILLNVKVKNEDAYRAYISEYGGGSHEAKVFQTNDQKFNQKLSLIHTKLLHAKPISEQSIAARHLGFLTVDEAELQAIKGDKEAANVLSDIAWSLADIATGILPVIGSGRALYESLTGKNLLNGQQLSDWNRLIAIAEFATFGFSRVITKTNKIFEIVSILAKKTARVFSPPSVSLIWKAKTSVFFGGKLLLDKGKRIHFLNAQKQWKNSDLTKAARDLSKHPGIAGYTKSTFNKQVRSDSERNALASKVLADIMQNTKPTSRIVKKKPVIEYRKSNGWGVRFDAKSGNMIGFISPQGYKDI